MGTSSKKEFKRAAAFACAVAAGLSLLSVQATAAEAHSFVGASVGQTTLKVDNVDGNSINFDESDNSYKVFGGYMFNKYIGVELGYVDFGSPNKTFRDPDVGSLELDVEVTGVTLELVGSIPVGPVDLFAKVGGLAYDVQLDATFDDGIDVSKLNADDSDQVLAGGVGAIFNIGQFGIRAEYEMYDVSDVEDVYLISVGAQFNF